MDNEAMCFLRALMAAPSPAGFEEPVQALVRGRLAGSVDELTMDVFGNVIGVLNPGGSPRIMITAHCDEIGLIVNYIDAQGYLYFDLIGGVSPRRLEGNRVRIHTEHGTVLGVIARKRLVDEKEPVKIQDLWIDIGARNQQEACDVVGIGDPITLAADLELLRDELMVSRAFDDKIGVYVVLEAMRLLRDGPCGAAVYCVSAVQEEVGSRGARTCAYQINPDIGFAVDVIETSDYPEAEKRTVGELSLGKGPVLSKGANFNPVLGKLLIDTARKHHIPYQLVAAPRPTYTDASVLQINRGGVATSMVRMPLRYMHTPTEIVSLHDANQSALLLARLIQELMPDVDYTPRCEGSE